MNFVFPICYTELNAELHNAFGIILPLILYDQPYRKFDSLDQGSLTSLPNCHPIWPQSLKKAFIYCKSDIMSWQSANVFSTFCSFCCLPNFTFSRAAPN